MKRILHQLRKNGKNVFPYTVFEAILDDDGKSLKQKLSEVLREFHNLKESVLNGALQGPPGLPGDSGKNIELRVYENIIQWRTEGSDNKWMDLMSIKDIIPDGSITDELGNIVDLKEWVTGKISNSIESSIVDNLDSYDENKSLSANQGRLLGKSVDKVLEYLQNLSITPDGNIEIGQGPKGEDGRSPEFINDNNFIKWKLEGDTEWQLLFEFNPVVELPEDFKLDGYATEEWVNLQLGEITKYLNSIDLGSQGPKGEDGVNPEIRYHGDTIQWKLSTDTEWKDLCKIDISNEDTPSFEKIIVDNLITPDSTKPLSANQGVVIKSYIDSLTKYIGTISGDNLGEITNVVESGKNIELRKNETHIQWRVEDEGDWIDLIAISDLIVEGKSINVIDNLNSDSSVDALSANQGKILNSSILKVLEFIKNIDMSGGEVIQGPKGDDGKKIQLKSNGEFIQWKYEDDDEYSWLNLISLDELIDSNQNINIIDNLSDNSITDALSANQGRILKEFIDKLHKLFNEITSQDMVEIIDSLNDTSKTSGLSANQGKILNENINNIKSDIEYYNSFNERLASTLFRPGYVNNDGNITVDVNEWTITYFEQVKPNTDYIIQADENCLNIRWVFYIIKDGQIEFLENDIVRKTNYTMITIPDNVYYIKIGFKTLKPNNTFLSYTLRSK